MEDNQISNSRSASSASSAVSDSEFASREDFDPFMSQHYKIKELEEEVKGKALFEKHLLWHCLMYREALKKLPGGLKSLRDTLHEFELDEETFLNKCVCCEHDDYKQKLRELQEKTNLIFNQESQLSDKERGCSSCCIDHVLVQIHDQHAVLQNDFESE